MNFSEALHQFDVTAGAATHLTRSLTTVDGKYIDNVAIKNAAGIRLEEYYKWQFIYAMIAAAGYSRDHIGTEIYFPKGNIGSAPIKIDACVFSSPDWVELYIEYRTKKSQDALNKLRALIIAVIEFKRDGKKIDAVFNSQIKAALKEPDSKFALGVYYDEGRLYIFRKTPAGIFRLDNAKNFPKSQRVLEQFQLELTDPYFLLPSYDQLLKLNSDKKTIKLGDLTIDDLDIVYTVNDDRIEGAINRIIRSLDLQSMVDDQGYMIIIHLIAAKVYDERQSQDYGKKLLFYITDEEKAFSSLLDESISTFIERLQGLTKEATAHYKNVLGESVIDWQNISHVKIACSVVENLQTFSFHNSRRNDLYQLVFYHFATEFKRDQHAQFLTPLRIIEFLVNVVNPRGNETVFDPCCGPSDFLAVSSARPNANLRAENLYGVDNDKKMVLLSDLNLLLSGSGNAMIRHVPDQGSLTHKFDTKGNLVALKSPRHKSGEWDNWPDKTELKKFDVVLTNPPFGKGRNLTLSDPHAKAAAELYELYDLYVATNPKDGLDLGVVFLENAVRSIKVGGRFGIVLSNSIASNNTWRFVRDWLVQQVRIVALFDLPPNIFAETGVNTTLIVGYKPKDKSLSDLIKDDYEVFSREIHKVGYVKRTVNRVITFETLYKLDELTFETVIDETGRNVEDEDFSETLRDFQQWCAFQEAELRRLFIG